MSARHWAQIGENTFVAGIWLLYWVHRLFGRWPFRLAVYPVIGVYWLARRDLRAASLQYLERLQAATGALGHTPTWRDGMRHVGLFAETLLDKLLAVSGRYRFENVHTEGREEIYAIAGRGVGGLLVTAHLGCLEIGRAMAGHRGVFRLNILVHTRHAAQFNRLLKRLNPAQDVNLIEVTLDRPGDRAAARREGGRRRIRRDRRRPCAGVREPDRRGRLPRPPRAAAGRPLGAGGAAEMSGPLPGLDPRARPLHDPLRTAGRSRRAAARPPRGGDCRLCCALRRRPHAHARALAI
ncbi:MAG: hypothetical protein NVV68_12010 [Dokdonella sp.]|nr:hypothetical protein [Dokdonella sp.]